jgi:hypothetical protein
VRGGGICECLWLGDNDMTLSMVKRAYQNFNNMLCPLPLDHDGRMTQ